MFNVRTFIMLLFLLLSFKVVAQNSCQEDIDKANKLFEEGIFRDAEKIILQSLETCDLNKSQENELLKLIASVYYEMDELEKGDEYTEKFLKKNPYYLVSKKNDPILFREAFAKLKSWPRFSIGIRGGFPLGKVETSKIYPVLDSADYMQPYTIKPAFQAAFEIVWNMNNFISLNLGAGLRINKIQQQVPYYNQIYFNYEEINNTINFPVALQFSIPTGGAFVPAFYFGGEFDLFINGSYSYAYTGNSNINKDFAFYLNRKRNNVPISQDQRASSRYAALGGIRLIYKLENFSIYADCRYVKEFGLYNNPDKRYTDSELYLGNNYALGDIQLENIDISLGFLYHFSYKVKSKY